MFGLSKLVSSSLGVVAAIGLLLGYNTWENYNIARDAKAEVAAEARQRAMALIEKRKADDEEISDMDERNICVELGGRWVPDESRCD